jgi:hypothetical protein
VGDEDQGQAEFLLQNNTADAGESAPSASVAEKAAMWLRKLGDCPEPRDLG